MIECICELSLFKLWLDMFADKLWLNVLMQSSREILSRNVNKPSSIKQIEIEVQQPEPTEQIKSTYEESPNKNKQNT